MGALARVIPNHGLGSASILTTSQLLCRDDDPYFRFL